MNGNPNLRKIDVEQFESDEVVLRALRNNKNLVLIDYQIKCFLHNSFFYWLETFCFWCLGSS